MRRFFTISALLILTAGGILRFAFHYDWIVVLYHFLSMGLLLLAVYLVLILIRASVKNHRAGAVITHTIAYGFWIFLCLFYCSILSSNYFWGNTITFDIFRNYLVSVDAILTILPVEKWILVSSFILFSLLLTAIYILIRPRLLNIPGKAPTFSTLNRKKAAISIIAALSIIFVSKNHLISLKRSMHFKQEPLMYFVLGPMWEVHSDELFKLEHKRSAQDQLCIDAVGLKPDPDRAVIIILLDALRSDHLPAYGYHRNTTPFLDSMVRSKAMAYVKNSFSTSTNTIGGISGLFYSKPWNNFNYSQLNLMQYFRISGFSTYAFLTGYHSGWYGLSAMYRQHCDNFYESTSAYDVATDDDLITLEKIKSAKFTTRSFLFIHLLSTHTIGKKNDQFRIFRPDKIGLNTGQVEALNNNYDNGIVQGDYVIREIFNKLRADNLLDKSTIFIVSDHGDLMGDDGLYGHNSGLHPKLLEVPMFVYDQDTSWYNRLDIASLADIAPTLSDRTFKDIPPCWEGKSLHNVPDTGYKTIVSAATAKSDYYNGSLRKSGDSITLNIFNPAWQLEKIAWRHADSTSWRVKFQR